MSISSLRRLAAWLGLGLGLGSGLGLGLPLYPHPHPHPHPNLKQALASQEQLLLFCDLHGHSRKRNIFMYGCENAKGARLKAPLSSLVIPLCRELSA